MYKHQVIGTRRAKSGKSNHILGICTLEAMDQEHRFASFDESEEWKAIEGGVGVSESKGPLTPKPGLTATCRYWRLEEVVEAMKCPEPKHQFYTIHPQTRSKTLVHSYRGRKLYTKDPKTKKYSPFKFPKLYVQEGDGFEEFECACGTRWIKTTPSDQTDNLHSLLATEVPCPVHNCPIVPQAAQPVSRMDAC